MDWLRIHVSNLCNFKCPNCHVFELGENNLPSRVMGQEVFNKTLDQYLQVLNNSNHDETMISIYGGETLANKKVIKEGLVRYGKFSKGIKLNWIVNTNGSLLKEEDVLFFKEYDVEIHISVDGEEDIHNLSRPTHKGKGTFHMVVPALELIKKHNCQAQINSYMMPSNYQHLLGIVDIAEKYGIKKIYLDQFYNLDMISHNVGMERYREVFYYALSKGIRISGPWERVVKRHEKFIKRSDQLKDQFSIDVNIDGTVYFPILSETKKETLMIDDLVTFFLQDGWPNVTERAKKSNEEKCDNCSIKDQCFGTAIEQVQYHVGLEADTEVSCNFFRDWCNFLFRPVYFKRFKKIDVISMIEIQKIEPMVLKISEEVTRLEGRLWELPSSVVINISEFHEEFSASSGQYNLPGWVKAVTVGEKMLFHLGSDLTPAIIHELVHLFIMQKNLQLPAWFIEGVCEWIQDQRIDREMLKNALAKNNLFKQLEVLPASGHTLAFLNLDKNIPSKNPYYTQAKAFVGFLETEWGWDGLLSFLRKTNECTFEEAFKLEGRMPLEYYVVSFEELTLRS